MRLTRKNARAWVGKMIRVDPGNCASHGTRGNNGGKQHKVPAKLKRVKGKLALVRPIRHLQDDWVPLSACHTWISGNHPR